MPLKKTIVSRRETVKLDNRGQLKRYVVVEYTLGDYGPFVFESPKDTFSWDLLRLDMEKEEKGLSEFL